MRLYWACFAILTPMAITAASCALDGFKFVGGGGGGSASSTATGAAGGDAGVLKCGVTYPDPPTAAVDGGTYDFTVALHTINFGDQSTVGLDLDHLCTCKGDGPSCQGLKMVCDDDQGRDNASAGLFNALTLVLKAGNFGSTFFSGKADIGEWSLLLRVRGYNGEANDAQVEVDWYVSTGISTKPAKPLWDGSDKWTISATSVVNMNVDQPKYLDKNAYVTNSMLVASLPDAELTVAGGATTMTVHLTGAGVLAKIEPGLMQSTWRLTEGQLVGRWKISDVFASIASYRAPPICTSNAFYKTAKGFVCNSADILAGQGTTAKPCDALSIGIGFTTDVANLGPTNPPPAPTPGCGDAGDPALDSCL